MDFNVVDNMLLLAEKLKELRQAKEQGKIPPSKKVAKGRKKKNKRGL